MISIKYQIKPIPNFPDYFASECGKIFMMSKRGSNQFKAKKTNKLKEIPYYKDSFGYLLSSLYKEGKTYRIRVHMLIYLTFLGPIPNNMLVRHGINGIYDNSINNLSMGTQKDNCLDKVRDNTLKRGNQLPQTKLNECQVRIIKKLVNNMPVRFIANLFDVSRACIHDIKRGRNWKWI